MRSLIQQGSWLFFAQGLARVIGFLYTIYLARSLGVAEFGVFSAALAYYLLLTSVSDFGFNRFLIREISVNKSSATKLLFNVAVLRLFATSILLILFAVFLYLLDPDKLRVYLTLLAVSAVLPQALNQTFDAVLVAFKKLEYSALGIMVGSFITSMLGLYFVNLWQNALGAVIAIVLGQMITLILLASILRHQGLEMRYSTDTKFLKEILKGSLPYGLLGILGLLYFRIDTLMLAYLKGNYEVGIYSAAYRFLEALVFIPSAFSTAFFPLTAQLVIKDPVKIYKMYQKLLMLLFSVSLVIVVAYLTILPIIIQSVLPEFGASIEVIKILVLTIPFMFMISPQGTVLLSHQKFLKAVIYFSAFNLSFNIIGNLILIPKFSYIGSAWSTVLSDIIVFLIFYIYIKSKLKQNNYENTISKN